MAERVGPLGAAAPVAIASLPPATRFVFRGSGDAADRCGNAFGCALPRAICRAERSDDRAALSLGPDEWLLLADEGARDAIAAAMAAALRGVPHSLVDVSHRQVAFAVSGPRADALLNAGCPLDLHVSAFPVGMATRTLLAKAEMTLWRLEQPRFRLEVARSFARYVLAFLKAAEGGIG